MVGAYGAARRSAGRRRQGGVSFLALLFAMALSGIALAGTGVLWQLEGRREKEKELLFCGEQYRRAIASYYEKTPGENKQYPAKVDELLDDKRHPIPVRHLRRLYREPMASDGQWGLIREQGRIIGVFSTSRAAPIKVAGFTPAQEGFDGASSYAEWRFIATGSAAPPANTAAQLSQSVPPTQP